MAQKIKDIHFMEEGEGRIVLFYPFIPSKAKEYVCDSLDSRWVGQGPKVDQFEKDFAHFIGSSHNPIAVGSGTDALHLSYVLSGISPGDEVVAPLFTCTATNIPFLNMGAKIRFADVQPDTLNIDPSHVRTLMTPKTKAIVCVHYGGLPCDMTELRAIADEWGVPIVEDAAHAVGATYKGQSIGDISEYTMFSFQAIKHLTTSDGGMLMLKDQSQIEKAKRIRWFGIDRSAKQGGIWENDIVEIGYKYQMTDIAAAMGLAALEELQGALDHRIRLFNAYKEGLSGIDGVTFLDGDRSDRTHAAWLCTILTDYGNDLQKMLAENNIESNQVHFRNDRYSIFKGFTQNCEFPGMDSVEDRYLVLPLHTKVSVEDVEKICSLIRQG